MEIQKQAEFQSLPEKDYKNFPPGATASTVPGAADGIGCATPQLIFMSIETDWGRKGGYLFLYEKQTPVFHTKKLADSNI
ncbi:hypothetical protein E2C01_039325 [Portunus trituberculatus]|uniref:Uncharacterized protein n=1 Tax=Portunus trituberculatus TaxID=210409 RepID=A0A5B7FDD3_PORTR|nr:hypothetical protein [Portunus trituberculatus]